MVKTIIFNNRCVAWSKNYMLNKSFIEQKIRQVYDLIYYRGYIYLDRIYELFGAGWDPHEPNEVLIFGENEPVISCKQFDDCDFKISICY